MGHMAQILRPWKAQLVDGAAEVFGSEPKAGLAAPAIDLKTLHTSAGHSSELRSGSL